MSSTYTFQYLDESRTVRIGTWTGDRAEAIERGLSHIGGSIIDGDVHYTDDTDGKTYRVSADEVAILGAALIAGPSRDAYSLWAADVVAEIVESDDMPTYVDTIAIEAALDFLNDIDDETWERVCGAQSLEEFATLALDNGEDIEAAWADALAHADSL